jgi:ribonuclease HI
MKFTIADITINNDSLTESILDRGYLKTAGYESKITSKITKKTCYKNVLIPEFSKEDLAKPEMKSAIDAAKDFSKKVILNFGDGGIQTIFGIYDSLKDVDVNTTKIEIVTSEIDESKLGITYTDGSSEGHSGEAAAYAAIKVLEKSYDPKALYDDFTDSMRLYEVHAGKIEHGTNNIGELTGIKTAMDNFDDKPIQLIISDSEYSIKCFREWYFSWKDNGFRSSSGKPVMNLDLIKSIYSEKCSSGKTVLLKWTKGHANNSFNERCDLEAKTQIGIKKN